MDYTNTAQSGNSYTHMWDVASTRQFDGGFLFDKETIPAGTEKLPKGVFLKVDHTERTAYLIKTAEIYEAIDAESTVVKIKKGHLLSAGDVIGINGTGVELGAITTSNDDYDSFAITADTWGALDAGALLQSYTDSGDEQEAVNPDGVNYAEVTLDAQPTCTVVFEAKGIIEANLPQKVTSSIRTALKFCQFIS